MNQNQQVLNQIISSITGTTLENVNDLINATKGLNGCRFVSLKGYSSDATDNQEEANHIINIGFIYDNMKKTDNELLANVNVQEIDVDTYKHYDLINLKGVSIDDYKKEVENLLPQALNELRNSTVTTTNRENNDIYLNKVLIFNTNTKTLCIKGQSIFKDVVVKAEPKITAKRPLTVAKELIKKHAGLRSDTYRRFKVSNLNSVKINGLTIEVE